VVLTVPKEKLEEACDRITEFCTQHYQEAAVSNGNRQVHNPAFQETCVE